MNHRERFVGTLTGRPVDRVPFIKVFGGDNAALPRWEKERPGISKEIDRLLGFEGPYRGWAEPGVNMDLSQVGEPTVIEDSQTRMVLRYSHGAVCIALKGGDYHRHTVEWPVKDRSDWDRIRDRHLRPDDPARFPADWPERAARFRSRDFPLQLTHRGVYGFARNMMGDENLAYAFYDDPDLVHEIMDSYTDFAIRMWERMVEDTDFDLIECWEDMASKNGSLISPATFREFLAPNYRTGRSAKRLLEGKVVCRCFGVTEEEIERVVRENRLATVEQVTNYCKAGGGCGNCKADIQKIIERVRAEAARREAQPAQSAPRMTNIQRIRLIGETLEREIRPALQKDGGDIELVDVVGNRVLVALRGMCAKCQVAKYTLKDVVEAKLREFVAADLVVEEAP